MIIVVISSITIIFGIFAICMGIWCLITGREKIYKQRYNEFMLKKTGVQNFIDVQRRKIEDDCN